MSQCFVIQPFDQSKFDRRYEDVFKPAIENAGLKPYRVDKDPNVRIPIEEIEKQILKSEFCFAEITTDNPNVWYELGYAYACGKDVVMVCSSDERTGQFPFDIQHKLVVTYNTGSKSDYEELEHRITERLLAFKSNPSKNTDLSKPFFRPSILDLKPVEMEVLFIIMEKTISKHDYIRTYSVQYEVNKKGYNDLAISIAFRTLSRGNMIEIFKDTDDIDQGVTACRLTEEGEQWILNSKEHLAFMSLNKSVKNENSTGKELPF